MTKFTKRDYDKAVAANEAAMIANSALLESFNNRLDAGEDISAFSEAWNNAHDATYAIEQDRAAIEQRWSRRNWTGADWARYDLVSNNID